MRFHKWTLIAVAAMGVVFSASAAMAHGFNGSTMNMVGPDSHSYSGAWPVTVTGSQRSNGTYCLTLTENGRNSGSASLVMDSQRYPYGSFVVVNHILMVNITEPLYGQNGALMFAASVDHGRIGQGIFENIEGGSNFDFGALAFGMKNGC